MPRTFPLLVLLTLLAAPAGAGDVTVILSADDGFVVKDNTGTIERLRVDEATGNVSRNGALFVHTTTANSTFVGSGAGNPASTGGNNTGFGQDALSSNTYGFGNSAFGEDALGSNMSGYWNSAFGSGTLRTTTMACCNSAFGLSALSDTTTGDNAAFGTFALNINTEGYGNSAFGRSALQSNMTGSFNVAVGRAAGANQTTGSNNIYLANFGVAGESGQIKIGADGTHSDAFIAGELALGGEDVQRTLLTLQGPDDKDTGPIVFLFGDASDQVESGRIRFVEGTVETNWRGAFVHFDGSANRLHLGIHDANTDSTTDDANVLTIERTTHHVGIQREDPAHPLHVGTDGTNGNGAHVTTGGTWTNGSSRSKKEGFEAVDPEVVLAKLSALPIQRWRYRGSDEGTHLGPMAEDFRAAFGLGADDAYITTVDAEGVALAAIQGLQSQLERQQRAMAQQQRTMESLRTRIRELESQLARPDAGASR